MHLVSAWASRQRLVLGQQAFDGKGNGITAIPRLLERLERTGVLVTINAIGCQRAIAEAIRAEGADDLLAPKDNWPTLAEEVRRHRVAHDVGWLSTNRRFAGEPRFPALAMVGMVEAEVGRSGKISTARCCCLSSAPFSAAQFARAVCAPWGIENRLHWIMDVVFHDDLRRLRFEHASTNMVTIRHTALNLLRAIPDKASFKVGRKTVAWDDDDLFHTLTQNSQ